MSKWVYVLMLKNLSFEKKVVGVLPAFWREAHTNDFPTFLDVHVC